jgi:hypothetical protein
MKKVAATLTSLLIFLLSFSCVFSANSILLNENSEYGGSWVVDGTTYTCRERIKWPDFGFYALGNTAEKLKLYMELTVSDKKSEPDGLGGDSGFLVGVTDVNGNGIIEEAVDHYYLIDVSSSTDGGFIGIEKNKAKWGDWAAIDRSSGFRDGDVIGLTLIYDPETAHFEIYITEIDDNGNRMTEIEPFLEWTDTDAPLDGAGYGICSKITDSTFKNVTVSHGDNATPPTERGYTPIDGTEPSILLADFTDPGFVIGKMVGTGNDCTLEYDEVEGCMKITVTGQDPFFYVPMNMSKYFDADKYHTIVINYKTDENPTGEIFFTSKYSRENIQKNHIFFYMDEAEEFTDVEIDMLEDDYGTWADQIRSIRIDPERNGLDGQVIYFRSVTVRSDDADVTDTVTETETETETEAETETVTEEQTEKPVTTDTEAPATTDNKTEEKDKNKPNVGIIVAVAVLSAAVIFLIVTLIIINVKKKRK